VSAISRILGLWLDKAPEPSFDVELVPLIIAPYYAANNVAHFTYHLSESVYVDSDID
jgi:hypothetical protein